MANLKASKQGKDRIRQARNDKGWPVDDPRWLVKASEILEPHRNWEVESPPFASGVSEGTWKAFLYRQRGIDTKVFKAYCKVLGLSWEEIREVSNKSLVNQGNSDWKKVCCEMLESQKQSIRRQATEIVSEPFYVQLGLVERRHQPRRGSDFSVSPEQGSSFFQLDKEEIIETYEHNEFLEQVIKQKQSKKSQGKRIAIIGEPGAGKTTLLESIAFSPKTPGFPIWISLGSLGEKSLEEYLCQKWLKDALKTSDVTQQYKQLEVRLSLLCQSWYFRQGDLPKTKAELYEQFTRAFYDWKEDGFRTTWTERKELNEKLGLLAREAIDQVKSRFGIRESFALDVLGANLFKLATEKLSWLVEVYKDVDTREKIYAFFHPTFQEYFAACAIPDCYFFLNHPFIFESHWREVIVLWLGREALPDKYKNEFLDALENFQECGGYYKNKAIQLAKELITTSECGISRQPRDYSLTIPAGSTLTVDVVDLLIRGCKAAESIIYDTDPILQIIDSSNGNLNFLSSYFEVNTINKVNLLLNQLSFEQNELNRYAILDRLIKLTNTGNDNDVVTINTLTLIHPSEEDIYRLITWVLTKIFWELRKKDKDEALSVTKDFVYLLKSIWHPLSRKWIAMFLIRLSIDQFIKEVAKVLVTELKDYVTEETYVNDGILYMWCNNILHYCDKLPYPDFYQAWHTQSSIPHLQASIPHLKTPNNILSQLQPTDKTYPIAIDTQTLKLETNTHAIAQKFCTKIYRKAGYSDIPTVNDAAQLQQYILRIQEQLQKQNLALILHGCEPTKQLIDFCYSLADRDLGIYIGLITSKPLEQPLKGFLPNQDNLLSAIHSWIDEIG